MTQIIPKEKRWHALSIGTLTGWAGVGVIDFFTVLVVGRFAHAPWDTFAFGLTLYLFIGLPVAFILCFLIGIPAYLTFERLSRLDKFHAIILGAVMGTVLGAINFIWLQSAYQNLWVWLDWLSTTLVGAIAGYVSFHFTKRPMVNIEGVSKQQTALRDSE